MSKRGQLVETHKRLLAQIKAHWKLGSADLFKIMDTEPKDFVDRQVARLEAQIEQKINADDNLATTASISRSVPRIGPVVSTMVIAEIPELGQITGEQAAALTGLASIAHELGAMRGKCVIGGGRRLLRYVMFRAALVAIHHNPVLKTVTDRLRAARKSHKIVITAIARKLVTIVNALIKADQKWSAQTD